MLSNLSYLSNLLSIKYMKLVLIGIPGSGKSTQGTMMSKQFGIPYLSTGHIFRQIAQEKTPLGRYVKETINAGLLIPDEKAITVVEEYLARPEYKNGYILDGFPRTTKQAQQFGNGIDKVMYIELPDKEALWRLAYRNDALRSDDTVATIKKRIDIFHELTKPVINFYKKRNQLVVVDGTKTIREVNKDILKSLGKELIQNHIREWNKKKKSIVCLVGLAGSGKTEAARFFKKKSIPIIDFGSVVNDYITKNKLLHSNEQHKKLREDIRRKHGMDAFARLNEDKIQSALAKNSTVVIDSIRSFEEYIYLKRKFKNENVIIVALYCNKKTRYKRVARRKERNLLTGEERDISELVGTNMGPTIAYADYLIDNSGTIADFSNKLEKVYREIYFS